MEFLKNLGSKKLIVVATSAFIVLVGLIILIMNLSRPTLVPMYSALSSEDTEAIIARLQALSVPHQLKADTNQIEVPADKVLALRMSMAQEGLPSSGQVAGYELFDKSDTFGTSQFVYNINMVRALEGELSRTISSLSSIASARVHLVLPKKELFSKNAASPSASIVLKMKGLQQLSKSETAAVAHIVATAVPDLKVGNITIVDDKGNPLKLSSEDGDFMVGGLIDSSSEYKINLENRLAKTIEELVSKSVGFGKVKASVSANIDFDREIINYETFDPEGQVIRSQRTSSETDKDSTKTKDLSVANNIPNSASAPNQGQLFGKERGRSDNIVNYEISKKVGNKISEQGRIKNLSIAVLVDGVYSKDQNGSISYSDRPEDEMNKLKALISSAVGLDLERGDKLELINLRFISEADSEIPEENFTSWFKNNSQQLIQTIVIGIILIIIVAMILKMMKARVGNINDGAAEKDILRSLDGLVSSNFDDQNVKNNVRYENTSTSNDSESEKSDQYQKTFEIISQDGVRYTNVAKYLNDTVESHLDETVAVIRNWLYK